ncbi:MAG: NAD(P)H-dependent oxidoreductase subunit E [Vulcanimicrobiota bacterium]
MPTLEREKVRKEVEELGKKYGSSRPALLPMLHTLQEKYGSISNEMMQDVAKKLNISPIEVYSTMSFYHFFKTEPKGKYVIYLCKSMSCDMVNKDRLARQFENELDIKFGETTKDGMFSLEYASCLGMCDQGPAVLINNKVFTKVKPQNVTELIDLCKQNKLSKVKSSENVEKSVREKGPILSGSEKPGSALKKALEMSRADLIEEIKKSGLKGRGGAGFPTGIKWQIAAASKGEEKYVVCNADEGEPGTFKDRLLLSDYANLVFEGMTIAGYAIGAKNGILYLRAEYKYMLSDLEKTLGKRKADGLLGHGVAGKDGFDFDIEIRLGAGAYVCGEETALIESLEGKRGEPRDRPPFPVVVGYNGFPTAVNNVETFVDAALILEKGADWFSKYGTEKTPGMKLFSVSGDCKNPGVYEFPMGITVKELLAKVGGSDAKAVQVGGASGSCVPAKDFDRKITYEDVATGGSIIVFGPERDMLEVAENFMEFFVEESCGQCFLCRKGNVKLLDGIEKLKNGECSNQHLEYLKDLARSMQKASKCGLGQTSSNAFVSILENFTDEILGRVPCK